MSRPEIIILTDLRSIRGLRLALLDLAAVTAERTQAAYLVLINPVIKRERLDRVMATFRRIVRPAIAHRLHLIVVRPGELQALPAGTPPAVRRAVLSTSSLPDGSESRRLARPDSTLVIGQLLACHFLRQDGPVAIKQVVEESGYSYPTVAMALQKLEQVTRKGRRVEFRHFPMKTWGKIVAMADQTRSTARFVDRSGSPRSPEHLLRRLARLGRSSVAVAGVLGARHHVPSLDLVGSPRLDLTLHSPHGESDLSFVAELDPALKAPAHAAEPAALVVHHLRRRDPLFEAFDGILWADPSECLLDLHDIGLEPQASQFVRAMREKGSRSS